MFPVHAGGEIYTVFDEESDFQIKDQFKRPVANIWKKPTETNSITSKSFTS